MKELSAAEFVEKLKEPTAWLVTEDDEIYSQRIAAEADEQSRHRLILVVGGEDMAAGEVFWGPDPGFMSVGDYLTYLDKVETIVKNRGI